VRFKRRKLEISPPFVPMADIAFNLVLFFLILAKTQDDSSIKWSPAQSTGLKGTTKSPVTIIVDEKNRVYLNRNQVSLRELPDLIAARFPSELKENRSVLLKIHKEALSATFEPILEAVSQAGCEVVHVLQEESKN
jgi:biopolymer transport protein ExbD